MTANAETQKLLTIEETANLLRVSPRTIRRRIYAGEIGAYRLGRQWRIARIELEEHLRAHHRGSDRAVL